MYCPALSSSHPGLNIFVLLSLSLLSLHDLGLLDVKPAFIKLTCLFSSSNTGGNDINTFFIPRRLLGARGGGEQEKESLGVQEHGWEPSRSPIALFLVFF
eukprot:453968-Pelagomonas_calceolata.AAC.2